MAGFCTQHEPVPGPTSIIDVDGSSSFREKYIRLSWRDWAGEDGRNGVVQRDQRGADGRSGRRRRVGEDEDGEEDSENTINETDHLV